MCTRTPLQCFASRKSGCDLYLRHVITSAKFRTHVQGMQCPLAACLIGQPYLFVFVLHRLLSGLRAVRGQHCVSGSVDHWTRPDGQAAHIGWLRASRLQKDRNKRVKAVSSPSSVSPRKPSGVHWDVERFIQRGTELTSSSTSYIASEKRPHPMFSLPVHSELASSLAARSLVGPPDGPPQHTASPLALTEKPRVQRCVHCMSFHDLGAHIAAAAV